MEENKKGQSPEKTISCKGGIQVSVWKREHEGVTYRSITVKRNYKDKEDKWKNTATWDIRNGLEVAKAIETLYTEYVQKEK